MTQSDTQITDSAPHPRATAAPVRSATAPPTEPQPADDLVEEDLLVEDVSIDGMCGVY